MLLFGSQQGKNGSMMRKHQNFPPAAGNLVISISYYEKSPPVRAANILRALFSGFIENLNPLGAPGSHGGSYDFQLDSAPQTRVLGRFCVFESFGPHRDDL